MLFATYVGADDHGDRPQGGDAGAGARAGPHKLASEEHCGGDPHTVMSSPMLTTPRCTQVLVFKTCVRTCVHVRV